VDPNLQFSTIVTRDKGFQTMTTRAREIGYQESEIRYYGGQHEKSRYQEICIRSKGSALPHEGQKSAIICLRYKTFFAANPMQSFRRQTCFGPHLK